MTKLLLGVILALALGLGIQTWRAASAADLNTVLRQTNDQLTGAIERQNTLTEHQAARFTDLDQSVLRLQQGQTESQDKLTKALLVLANLTPEPGDSDETIRCAGLPVPAGVDRQLRQ